MVTRLKEESKILQEYRTKYYFISCALDILEEQWHVFNEDEVMSQDIFAIYNQRYSNIDTHWNASAKQFELYLRHMRWMGLISLDDRTDNWKIRLTDAGKNAFQSQVYHSIAASLYYSKKTEKLSKISIGIAMGSLVIAVLAIML